MFNYGKELAQVTSPVLNHIPYQPHQSDYKQGIRAGQTGSDHLTAQFFIAALYSTEDAWLIARQEPASDIQENEFCI